MYSVYMDGYESGEGEREIEGEKQHDRDEGRGHEEKSIIKKRLNGRGAVMRTSRNE